MSHSGFHVVLADIDSVISQLGHGKLEPEKIDLELLDFYAGRKYVDQLLARQNGRCIYTLRKITLETAHLDHLKSLTRGGDNSYRNIVVCTSEANTRKGDRDAVEFLRQVFREGLLSEDEYKQQLRLIELISSGELKPDLN